MASEGTSHTDKLLEEKLENAKHPWSSNFISGLLTPETIGRMRWMFWRLSTQTKLKILMSMLHLKMSMLSKLKEELEALLVTALADGEESVTMLAEMLKDYPSKGTLNSEFKSPVNELTSEVFEKLTTELSAELAKAKHPNLIPLECYYMNKTPLKLTIGEPTPPVVHFQVKGKTKAQILRETLLMKAQVDEPKGSSAVRSRMDVIRNRKVAIPYEKNAIPKAKAGISSGKAFIPNWKDFVPRNEGFKMENAVPSRKHEILKNACAVFALPPMKERSRADVFDYKPSRAPLVMGKKSEDAVRSPSVTISAEDFEDLELGGKSNDNNETT